MQIIVNFERGGSSIHQRLPEHATAFTDMLPNEENYIVNTCFFGGGGGGGLAIFFIINCQCFLLLLFSETSAVFLG